MFQESKILMILCVAWSCLSLVSPAAIDPDHVPTSVCVSMLPRHGEHKPSTETVPYTIIPSKEVITPGETINVKISGLNGEVFRGIYLQARVEGSGSNAVGTFTPVNLNTNSAIRISSCPPGSENAVSYVSREPLNEITIEWKAPDNVNGNIYFRTTIVKTFSVFWVNVDSDAVAVQSQRNPIED